MYKVLSYFFFSFQEQLRASIAKPQVPEYPDTTPVPWVRAQPQTPARSGPAPSSDTGWGTPAGTAATGAGPCAPLTADDGADQGGVPRAVHQRELELAGPRAQLRRQRGAQAGEAQVQRDAPRAALRSPVEGGGGAGGAERPCQRRLPAVDVAQHSHVHVEDAGGHGCAAPARSVPTAPLRQRGPRRRRSGRQGERWAGHSPRCSPAPPAGPRAPARHAQLTSLLYQGLSARRAGFSRSL